MESRSDDASLITGVFVAGIVIGYALALLTIL